MKCGIDYSMSNAAIFVEDDQGKRIWYLMQTVKKLEREEDDIVVYILPNFTVKLDRAIYMANWATEILLKHKATEVNIEGFSMMSMSGMVFDIGAHSGILYSAIKNAGIDIFLIPPKSAKKHFSGNGNASKELMCDTFKRKQGFAFSDRLGTKANESPENDLVDAFAIAFTPPITSQEGKKMFC